MDYDLLDTFSLLLLLADEECEEESEDLASSGSVFCQLEKTRVDLETKVGMESLLQAYQLIQVYIGHLL